MVSGTHRSSGKTTVAIGLVAALARTGSAVQAFKKGPDYIDPLWLARASGRPCRNLDPWLMAEAQLRDYFLRHASGSDVALVEGNLGLFDGVSLDGSDCNAALARALDLPVVLVMDTKGMARGIAPILLGYRAFDPEVRIAGVILNRVGNSRHEAKLRAAIEHYTGIEVLGAVHEDARLGIVERHLGLVPGNESVDAGRMIDAIGDAIAAQVDVRRVLAIARDAQPRAQAAPATAAAVASEAGPRIGIAMDRAFGFYYPDDLDAFREAGATLVPFDTLNDAHLPDVDALFIGGGFPEVFAAELEANATLRGEVRAAVERGMPVYAECGGLMYLARTLTWRGRTAEMAGAIPGDVVMHERAVGRGYVELAETAEHPWPQGQVPGDCVRGHEFHHSSLENLPAGTRFAYRMLRGHGIDGGRDGVVHRNVLATYSHFRSVAGHDWAGRFTEFARQVRLDRQRDGTGVPQAQRMPTAIAQ
jgi:cobyrinic acid a,c-diamide synthase